MQKWFNGLIEVALVIASVIGFGFAAAVLAL